MPPLVSSDPKILSRPRRPKLTVPCFSLDGKPILNLPARTINVVSCEFDKSERDFYDALEKKQTLTFNKVSFHGAKTTQELRILTFGVLATVYQIRNGHDKLYERFDIAVTNATRCAIYMRVHRKAASVDKHEAPADNWILPLLYSMLPSLTRHSPCGNRCVSYRK